VAFHGSDDSFAAAVGGRSYFEAAPTVDAKFLRTGTVQMIPATANEHEPDDRLTGAGLAFLAISIVIGMGIGGGNTCSLVAGVAMLILPALIYFIGSARREGTRSALSLKPIG
jgi:hypothetical protein